MVSIPKVVQEFIPGKLAWVATASTDGMPNVTPKGSLKLLDDTHVVFADLFSLKTPKEPAGKSQGCGYDRRSRDCQGLPDQGHRQGDRLRPCVRGDRQADPSLAEGAATRASPGEDHGGVSLDQSVGPKAGKQIA